MIKILTRLGRGQSGMSLVAILVALAIGSIVVVVIAQMFTNMTKSKNHLEIRAELTQLRGQLADEISCSRSIPTSALASCATSLDPTGALASPPYVQLRDKKGNLVGKPNADGSTAIGRWHFRSRCVKSASTNVLQISTARLDVRGTISKDPLNGKPLGWMPLFDDNSALSIGLCSEEIAGNDPNKPITAPHLASTTMTSVGSGCGDGLLASFVGGSSRLYRATVMCPAKSIAINGGVECMSKQKKPKGLISGVITGVAQALAGSPKGMAVASRPDTNGRGWYMECCLQSGGTLGGLIGGQFLAPRAYATCIPEP